MKRWSRSRVLIAAFSSGVIFELLGPSLPTSRTRPGALKSREVLPEVASIPWLLEEKRTSEAGCRIPALQ